MTVPDWEEQPLLFACQGEQLVGMLSRPAGDIAQRSMGVLVVVGGPQVRSGSHRQFVQLARALAAQGWPVLRFDVRGMGDSGGTLRNFEHLSTDIAAGMQALCTACPDLLGIALWGLCDGASAALLYMNDTGDSRVSALCLANPWVRSEVTLARTQVKHYYRDRVLQREFWGKLLRGGVGLRALRSLASNVAAASGQRASRRGLGDGNSEYQTRMARAWSTFRGPILLALSGDDYTAKEFLEYTSADAEWRGLLTRPQVSRCDFPAADHTFSAAPSRQALESAVAEWLATLDASKEARG